MDFKMASGLRVLESFVKFISDMHGGACSIFSDYATVSVKKRAQNPRGMLLDVQACEIFKKGKVRHWVDPQGKGNLWSVLR